MSEFVEKCKARSSFLDKMKPRILRAPEKWGAMAAMAVLTHLPKDPVTAEVVYAACATGNKDASELMGLWALALSVMDGPFGLLTLESEEAVRTEAPVPDLMEHLSSVAGHPVAGIDMTLQPDEAKDAVITALDFLSQSNEELHGELKAELVAQVDLMAAKAFVEEHGYEADDEEPA